MRHSTKMLVCVAVIFTLAFLGPKAFAGDGGMEQAGGGEPPKGLAIGSDAAGQKLTGDLFTEDWNWAPVAGQSDYAAVLRVAVRLHTGNQKVKTYSYFTDLSCQDVLPNCTGGTGPECLLRPICKTNLSAPPWTCPDIIYGCYDVMDVPTIQKALMAWMKADPKFCQFLQYFGFSCEKISKISLIRFEKYSHVLAKDPNGIIDSSIHLSDIEIAIK
jgi:hypothetical protein